MPVETMATLIGLFVHVLSVIVGLVWAVSRIRSSADVAVTSIRASVDGLSHSVKRLESAVFRLDTKVQSHSERLARIETAARVVRKKEADG